MPGADKFLGVSLYAAKPLDKLSGSGKVIGKFKKGDFIGIIDSWIVRNGKVLWQFYENNQFNPLKAYYVVHEDNNFILTDQIKRIKDLEAKKQKLKDAAELQQYQEQVNANTPWYTELGDTLKKWIPWIIAGAIGAGVIKEVIKKKL